MNKLLLIIVIIMSTFACKDIGMECGFKTSAETKDELMKNIAMHAESVHGMTKIDSATLEAINKAIK